jgi:hypothetical protein
MAKHGNVQNPGRNGTGDVKTICFAVSSRIRFAGQRNSVQGGEKNGGM